jgi:hypothetical protein
VVVLVVVMVVLVLRLIPPLQLGGQVVRVDQAAQEIRGTPVLRVAPVVLVGQQALQPLIALP